MKLHAELVEKQFLLYYVGFYCIYPQLIPMYKPGRLSLTVHYH